MSTQISVIVPVYKTPLNHLTKCLKSLLHQTLQNAEFIIIFDGENDLQYSCCETYKQKDFRFKMFKQPHLGVSAARNFGINLAKGKYITFVDADDTLYSSTILEMSCTYHQSNNSDITIFSWTSNNQIKNSIWQENKKELSSEEIEYCLKQNIHIQDHSFSGAPWAKIFTRDFLAFNRIYFNTNCLIGQDRVFNYETISKAKKISYCNTIFYNYKINKDSATQRYRPDFLPIVLNYVEELNKLAPPKYASLIGRETLDLFYLSWNRCYMNPNNKNSFFKRMKELTTIVCSEKFLSLIKYVDSSNTSLLFKIEQNMLQHKFTFWIYFHGLIHLKKNPFKHTKIFVQHH